MPFHYQWLCDLLEELDKNRYKSTLSASRAQSHEPQIVNSWYQRLSHKIERTGPSAIAFLSCILPERRPDRVYNLQAKRLSQVFGRALGLGASRAAELNKWRDCDGVDFPTCVELTLQNCENAKPAPGREVTLEEIDNVLELVAAHAPSSSPAIRAKRTNESITDLLASILRRLRSNEAKWFARMLIKSYAPVQIPEYQVLHGFHFMLPNLLAIQNSFEAAIGVLATDAIRQLPARPDKNYEHALQSLVSSHVHPQTGVMIRRQPYFKARSIKNGCNLANGRQMSVERKYDGEYCQLHIDMSKSLDCIQIFSKSGKDSTSDRIRLHSVVKDALRIGRNGCRIRNRCIIEGELLVWSATRKKIQPFYKIRRHVKHGGRDLGTAQDSPRRADENLMVAFYDILMLDDHMLLNKPHKVRRQYLKMVLQTTEGRAILCERKVIDFRANGADKKLRNLFAQAITQRWEGLVLKGLNEPYFSWNAQNHGIKLKKDYITALGDTADLCIVGGRRDPQVELQIGLGRLIWTSFYVGAVCNMEVVRRFDAKPRIKIIDVLTHHSMPNSELTDLNRLGKLVQTAYAPTIVEFDVEMGRMDVEKPTDLFKRPFIVEIMGAGFERPSNSAFWTLRFPRKIGNSVKMHTDRTLLETVSFAELQEMAEQSISTPGDKDSQEDADWIERLVSADGKKSKSDSISQAVSSARTPVSTATNDFSLIYLKEQLSSPVFIRPDTEEPETQGDLERGASSQSLDKSVGRVTGQSSPTKATKSQSVQTSQVLNKRGIDVLASPNNQNSKFKRRCLGDIQIVQDNQAVPYSQSTAEKTTQEPDTVRRSLRVQDEHLATHQPSNAASRSMTTPCPQRDTTSFHSAREHTSGELLTPNSTRLMRRLLTCHHNTQELSDGLNAAKVTRSASAQGAKHTTEQTDPRATSSLPSLLPTPPISSPAAESETTALHSTGIPQILAKHEPQGAAQKCTTTSSCPVPLPKHNCKAATSPAVLTAQGPIRQQPLQSSTKTCEQTSLTPVLVLSPQPLLDFPLSNINVSFTFSTDNFISQIAARGHTATSDTAADQHYYLILVDPRRPESVADSFEAMARRLQTHLQVKNDQTDTEMQHLMKQLSGRLLVFDTRVLQHRSIAQRGGIFDVNVLKTLDFRKGRGRDASLFCGVLEIYEREGGAYGDGIAKVGMRLQYRFDWIKPV